MFWYLKQAVVQRQLSHVFDVLSILADLQLHQDVMPLSVIDSSLVEVQHSDTLHSHKHLETQVAAAELDEEKVDWLLNIKE